MKWKALFFDIDDTIFDYKKCSETALKKTCQRLGTPYSEQLLEEYRKLDDVLWPQQKQGKLRMAQVIQRRADGMTAVMGKISIGREFAVIFDKELGKTTDLVAGIKTVLEDVAGKGYALFCASNGTRAVQISRLQRSGLLCYFKDVYVSDEIGYEKPARQFFDECLKASGYSRTDVLMIGDSVSADIQGALSAGWQACYLNRNNVPNAVKCFEIHVWNELLELL